MRPRKFPSVWAERIQHLMWATGERHKSMSKRLGTSSAAIIGGRKKRVTVHLVRTLQALEWQFAADLEALAEHKIRIVYHGKQWTRYDYRRIETKGRGQALGDVGLSRQAISRDPQKTVYFSYDSRNRIKIHRADESRRPTIAASGSGNASAGVSRCPSQKA